MSAGEVVEICAAIVAKLKDSVVSGYGWVLEGDVAPGGRTGGERLMHYKLATQFSLTPTIDIYSLHPTHLGTRLQTVSTTGTTHTSAACLLCRKACLRAALTLQSPRSSSHLPRTRPPESLSMMARCMQAQGGRRLWWWPVEVHWCR